MTEISTKERMFVYITFYSLIASFAIFAICAPYYFSKGIWGGIFAAIFFFIINIKKIIEYIRLGNKLLMLYNLAIALALVIIGLICTASSEIFKLYVYSILPLGLISTLLIIRRYERSNI